MWGMNVYSNGVCWPIWPPCRYMVKKLQNLLLHNWETGNLETCCTALRPLKFVQMMIPGWRLTFLHKGQIDFTIHVYGKTGEKSIFKWLLLWNPLASLNHISCLVSWGQKNENLFKWLTMVCWPFDENPIKNLLLWETWNLV